MKKKIIVFLSVAVFTLSFSLVPCVFAQDMEKDTDRPGMDYKDFDLPSADVQLCRNTCLKDSKCKAFTYVKPGQQGANARCWLKSDVPSKVASTCCESGVMRVSTPYAKEVDTDRPGIDYESFDITDSGFANVSPEDRPDIFCKEPCMKDSKCRAWTYVRPGIQGPKARCWLKSDVPSAVKDECCVSGVISNVLVLDPNMATPINIPAVK